VTSILNIETATTVCSVSLTQNGKIISLKELDEGFSHAENLHLFIREVLLEAGISLKHLSAICVSKGPGSYTGLRIGASTAKGLAFAIGLPLISINTLQVMSAAALVSGAKAKVFCPLIDARRMEVYTALFDQKLNVLKPTSALIVDEESIKELGEFGPIVFFGDGMEKCRSVLDKLDGAEFLTGIKPSAKFMGELGLEKYEKKQFEDVSDFEPFYLKEFLAGKKKNE
jgi:tRNA threonylcarbamoyladenosine biosynthesis protein TsaB